MRMSPLSVEHRYAEKCDSGENTLTGGEACKRGGRIRRAHGGEQTSSVLEVAEMRPGEVDLAAFDGESAQRGLDRTHRATVQHERAGHHARDHTTVVAAHEHDVLATLAQVLGHVGAQLEHERY